MIPETSEHSGLPTKTRADRGESRWSAPMAKFISLISLLLSFPLTPSIPIYLVPTRDLFHFEHLRKAISKSC